MNFIKTTIIGGLVFLVPVVVLVIVIAKVYDIMLTISEPMADVIPVDAVGGIALANIIAALIILLICFVAGLVARAAPARKLVGSIEKAILSRIPGYSVIRELAGSLTPERTAHMHPVLVSLGYSQRVGMEVESVGSKRVAVYFPGSPNAWSGEVHVVDREQVEQLEKPLTVVIENAEQLGKGSNDILT